MGDSLSAGSGHGNLFSFLSRHKRGTFAFAGAFAAAGLITTVGVQAQSDDTPSPEHVNATLQTGTTTSGSSTSKQPSPTGPTASVHASDSGNAQNVQLNVNGQDISVPENGSTQQTVPATDDGNTSVSVDSTTVGGSSNSSSSSLNINISSDSSSSGSSRTSSSTIIHQNGGTTIIRSH